MSLLSRFRFSHFIALLLGVSAALRLYGLGSGVIWYDEIGTVVMSAAPLPNMIAATAGDVHPPLYLLLTSLVTRLFGDSAFVLRLPSLIFSLAAFPLIMLIGKQLKLNNIALGVGLTFFGVAPFQLYYAQEARMYSLVQLEVLFMFLAMMNKRYALMAAAFAALLWTHNYAIVYGAVVYALALLRDRASWKQIIKWFVPPCLLYAPWGVVLISQITAARASWWQLPTTPGGFLSPLYQFVFKDSLSLIGFQPLAQVVVYALAAFAVYQATRQRGSDSGGVWLSLFSFSPLAMAYTPELFYRPIFLERGLIGAAPFFYLLLGWGLSKMNPRKVLAWGAALLPLLAMGVLFYYPLSLSKGFRSDVVGAILNDWREGDVIIHLNAGSMYEFYLSPLRDAPQYVYKPFPLDQGALSLGTMRALGWRVIDDAVEVSFSRAWLVWSAAPTVSAAQDDEVARLLAKFEHEQVRSFSLPHIDSRLVGGGVWKLMK